MVMLLSAIPLQGVFVLSSHVFSGFATFFTTFCEDTTILFIAGNLYLTPDRRHEYFIGIRHQKVRSIPMRFLSYQEHG